ncbi:ATP-binding cassette domain-containing protein [Haladaptatus sp. GCM10025707]|uniref:ABC transporter ATP-binding protein n=1 Tax=unclassified Haladaptatus TaxID=2622732 RepID=UPI0023E7A7C1|nr:ABC transporter ATP-binding protein [Haladaptatus sp. QDMS2]
MAAIELANVTKRYDDVAALKTLDLTVERGEIYGFLGPNGAGKSTTINLLLDFIRPTAGTVTVLGHDAQAESLAVRQQTGVLPEGFSMYNRLTGRKHVEFAIESKEASDDPDALLRRVGLEGEGDRKAGGYSKGMRQRLALAMAIAGSPELLILDEPSTGLDPNGAREMRRIITEERDRGATVFFSSHILEQVEAICDRVGILRKGELVAEDTLSALRDETGAGTTLVITVAALPDGALDAVRSLPGVLDVSHEDDTVTVACEDGTKTRVLTTLEDNGATVTDFSTKEASLEDLFASYTEVSA